MTNHEPEQDPKAFILSIFAEESQRQEVLAEEKMHHPIDLGAGGAYNLERFLYYYVKQSQKASYDRRVHKSVEGLHSIGYEEAVPVNNVFLNMERLLFDLIAEYYDTNQLRLFSKELSLISDDMKEATHLYQRKFLEMLEHKEHKWDLHDKMLFMPGWAQQARALKANAGGGRVSLEMLMVNYLLSDLAQCYINCLTEALRTDMILLSQFVYQLGLLKDNVAAALVHLYQESP